MADPDRPVLTELFPPGVVTEEVVPAAEQGRLHPLEEASLAGAGSKRRLEFTAGRGCARRALARLGIACHALPAGPDRVPLWPAGAVGSISHGPGLCGAAVARSDRFRAVGLDIEGDAPLAERLWRRVLTADERRRLGRQPEARQGELAKAVFSAKECAYKCQHALTGRFLGFADVEVELAPDGGTFVAVVLADAGPTVPSGTRLEGRFLRRRGLVLAGMAVPR